MFANTLVRLHIDVIFARRALLAKNTLWTMLCGIQEKPLIIAKPAARSIHVKSISLTICALTRTTLRSVVKYAVSYAIFYFLYLSARNLKNANDNFCLKNNYQVKKKNIFSVKSLTKQINDVFNGTIPETF